VKWQLERFFDMVLILPATLMQGQQAAARDKQSALLEGKMPLPGEPHK
jgi:hypothetical protein